MLSIVSNENVELIKAEALDLVSLIKADKFYLTSNLNGKVRIKASDMLLSVIRVTNGEDRFKTLEADNDEKVVSLKASLSKLSELMGGKPSFLAYKISDYSKDIKAKLCRETVPFLDELYMKGEASLDDIEWVYKAMGKLPPKKFQRIKLNGIGKCLFSELKAAIAGESEDVKVSVINHYNEMVNRIDPEGAINSVQDFYTLAREKVSDMNTVRLCLTYKFNREMFMNFVNEEFETMITTAAFKLSEKCHNTDSESDIKISELRMGAKGFDLKAIIDGRELKARAIPVEGYFVRFHHRYIIT